MKRTFTFLLALLMLMSLLPAGVVHVDATQIEETTVATGSTQPVEETAAPEETETETTAPNKRETETVPSDISGSCGESATWLLDETGTLTISGTGAVDSSPWSAGDVLKLVIEDGISSIEKSVFYEHANLTEVTLAGSVKRIGENAFERCRKLTTIQFAAGLETIGSTAFGYCTGLTEITLPDGLHTISNRAFMNCTKLETISIPNTLVYTDWTTFQSCPRLNFTTYDNAKYLGNSENPYVLLYSGADETPTCIIHPDTVAIGGEAFSNNDSLAEIAIPKGIRGIGPGAFYSCGSLKTVCIPDNVTKIYENTFSCCTNLTTVTLGCGVTYMGDDAFSYCGKLTTIKITNIANWCNIEFESYEANPLYSGTTILCLNGKTVKSVEYPKGTTAVQPYAFANYQALTSVKLPSSVKYIGEGAFADCDNLTSVTLASGLEHIGGLAFSYCGKLKSISIPDTVITIDAYAFEFCGLTRLPLGDSIRNIGNSAFFGCTQLTSVTIPGSVKSIGKDAFSNCTGLTSATLKSGVPYVSQGMFSNCKQLKTVTLPNTVQYIDQNAFYCDIKLSSINIPDGVERIGTSAFSFCKLKSISIPGSVQSIGNDAFIYNSPKTITISEGVQSIGTRAFYGCTSLSEITIPGTVTAINANAFGNCKALSTVYFTGEPEAWTALIDGHSSLQAASVRFPSDISKLSAPKLSLQADGVTLCWTGVPYASAYEVYRATSKSGKYSLMVTVTDTTWFDPAGSQGTSCYYKIIALRTEPTTLRSSYSNAVSIAYKCDAPVITAEPGTTGKPVISWEKVSGAKQYTIYRATSEAGKYGKLGTSKTGSYTDSKAKTGTTYFYKVIANASSSTYNSGYSNIESCNVICSSVTVTVKIDAATGKPSLSWKKVDGATGYRILRQLPGEEDFTVIKEQTAVTFTDTSAPIDTQCIYLVQVIGKTSALDSQMSKEISATSGIAKPVLKTSVDASGKPELHWQTVEGAVKYEIYRSTKSTKSYSLLTTVEATGYTDESVAPGKTYYYKVIAIGAVSKSAESSYAKLSGKCATPTISVAVSEESGKPVISWEKISGAKKYTVYRATSETGKYSKLGTTTKLTYTDSKATVGKTYYYKIVANASSSSYNSAYSNMESCLTICAKPVVKATTAASTGKPTLSWSKVTGAKEYWIFLDVDGQAQLLTTTTKLSFTDEAAAPGETRTYAVLAVNANPVCNSPMAAVTVTATCAQPKIKGAVGQTGKPEITITAVEGATKYVVYRSTSKSKNYKAIDETESLTFTDTTAKKGKTYYYKVVAVCEDVASAHSAYVKVKSK